MFLQLTGAMYYCAVATTHDPKGANTNMTTIGAGKAIRLVSICYQVKHSQKPPNRFSGTIRLPRQEMQVQYLGQDDPLEKAVVTHVSILTWRIPWTEEPGGLQSMGSQRVRYNWDLGVLKPLPVCEFEMGGPEGIVESIQIMKEGKASASEAVDCKWYIRAPPRSKIYLRFLDYEMQNSNECKRNFVAVYDGSSSVEDLKAKFCSTVANDVMLRTGLGVIRMWADEGSRNSRFQMLFTSFQEQKRKAGLLDQLTNTSGTVIGVTSCIVIILIIISVIVQIKQPRKKYVQRKSDFDQTVFQEVFEPPHYELCTLRGTGATADFADVADDFENYHKLRRSSSKCIHDHHCGSQLSSAKGSRSNLSTRDASVLTEMPPQPVKPLIPPVNRRNILVMKHNYSQEAADACDIDEIEEVPTTSHRLSRHEKAVQRFCLIGSLSKHESEYNTTRV
ncbi:hypothetical protein FD755_010131 [Muntiacus reevesi]|uniref:CUB domain-containing protein n=1 Tax=Muntiacus reevesi TaxID=9886 RepID=A0A5N3XXR0_MUNRE|nr:hypothetical protein FD755_010131 [Muntiacus reevesi]